MIPYASWIGLGVVLLGWYLVAAACGVLDDDGPR